MDATEILTDAFQRTRGLVHRVADGLDAEALAYRPDSEANSIAWLLWHATRVQDDHVSELAGHEQAWTADGWAGRLDLPFDPADIGFGHTAEQVAAVRPDGPEILVDYHDTVVANTLDYLGTLTAGDLDRIVDHSWDPPVTMGVRLVSVVNDQLQHLGQAAYVRGLVERRER